MIYHRISTLNSMLSLLTSELRTAPTSSENSHFSLRIRAFWSLAPLMTLTKKLPRTFNLDLSWERSSREFRWEITRRYFLTFTRRLSTNTSTPYPSCPPGGREPWTVPRRRGETRKKTINRETQWSTTRIRTSSTPTTSSTSERACSLSRISLSGLIHTQNIFTWSMMYVKYNVYYFYPVQIRLKQPSKCFWF